jgi:acetyl-CoA carboxylase biotin carboxyl carrier protein
MSETTNTRMAADLEILAGLFKAGGWSELRIESPGVSLLLSNDATTPGLDEGAGGSDPSRLRAAPSPGAPVDTQAQEAAAAHPAPLAAPVAASAIDATWAVVSAPNLGTFYRSPKPGAPSFVEVGQRVEAGTEVCLIEVMKLFTSVQAGIAGTVRHVAASDAELVQGGQPLIYIERD